jgi:hemoglobin-like flavoprotein
MTAGAAELMEASLVAVADSGVEIRHRLFDRFFAAYPERRATFINLEASSVRMTDETVQMMFGLATNERWVEPLVAELVFTHRNFGALPMAEYDAFIDLTVEELGAAAGASWTPEAEAAWRAEAARLKAIIARMKADWTRVMPGAPSATSIA